MKGRQRLLVILLAALCLAIVYAVWSTPRQAKVATRSTSEPAGQTTGDRHREPLPGLPLEQLDADLSPYPGSQRDIFRFRVKPSPQPVHQKPVPQPTPLEPIDEPSEAVVQEQQVVRELSQFTLLGFVEKASGRIVFFRSGADVFVVRAGERFGGEQEFLLEKFVENRMVIRRTGHDESMDIPLVENEPLAVSSRPATVHRPLGPQPALNVQTPFKQPGFEKLENDSGSGENGVEAAHGDDNGIQE